MVMAESSVYITRDAIQGALRQAVAPYIGQYVRIWEPGHGKGAQWHPIAGPLVACYPSGLLVQGPRYCTWINTIDFWIGRAQCDGAVGEAIDAAYVRLRTGGNPFVAALATWIPSA